jgi:hypothetical protein
MLPACTFNGDTKAALKDMHRITKAGLSRSRFVFVSETAGER